MAEQTAKNEKVTEKTNEKVAEKKAEKKAAPKVDIIRGRMPLPIVQMIKFEGEGVTDGALAAKFRTTNGKVSDIRKDRNFGYIDKDYVPSQDQIDKAKEFAAQLEDKSILKAIEAMKPATEEQNKAFEEKRKASRPTKVAAKKEEAKVEDKVDAEDLSALTE